MNTCIKYLVTAAVGEVYGSANSLNLLFNAPLNQENLSRVLDYVLTSAQ